MNEFTKELLEREGQITLEEWKKVRANSDEFLLLYPRLNNEALIYATQWAVLNCGPPPSKHGYANLLQNILVPELLKRLPCK